MSEQLDQNRRSQPPWPIGIGLLIVVTASGISVGGVANLPWPWVTATLGASLFLLRWVVGSGG